MDLPWRSGQIASRVFDDAAAGLAWIARHRLSVVLTEHEVGDGCYELAVLQGRFRNMSRAMLESPLVAVESPHLWSWVGVTSW
jgi:hypothetical protein